MCAAVQVGRGDQGRFVSLSSHRRNPTSFKHSGRMSATRHHFVSHHADSTLAALRLADRTTDRRHAARSSVTCFRLGTTTRARVWVGVEDRDLQRCTWIVAGAQEHSLAHHVNQSVRF